MADQNIALGVQVPDAMKSISGMLNFASQAQNLKNSQQQYQRQNVDLEKERIILGERKAIQDLFSNPQSFNGDDGQMDYNKLINQGMRVAPTTFPSMVPQIISAHRSGIDAKAALNSLDNQERDAVGQFIGTLANDDPQTARQKLDGLAASRPSLKPAVDFAWKYLLSPASQSPEQWKGAVLRAMQGALAPASQVGAMTPQYQQTGQVLVQTNPVAAANGAAPGLGMTIAPSDAETLQTDALGNRVVVQKGPTGAITNVAAAPGSQSAPPVMNLPAGDREAIPALEGERTAARNALGSAGIAHATNEGILSEIDKVTTGSLGPTLQKLFSSLGAAFGTAEERASAYDVVGKYLERNAIEAAKAMGPNTNAGLEAAIKANGSVAYNPTAIKKITKLNDAIVSGLEAYQPGLEKAIAANPQLGVLAKRQFDQAWGQNFDPRIMMLDRAMKRGDMATVTDLQKELGKSGMEDLLRKARNLDRLTAQGRL